jgi:DNA mismatch endonuclease (patch repair protein)
LEHAYEKYYGIYRKVSVTERSDIVDRLTAEQRHKNMKNIKSKDTSIELKLRKELWHRGYRYRKNYAELPGKPDIVLTKYKIAIFCDSEFFHGKDWEVLKPRLENGNNPDFWISKISRNRQRDDEINKKLLYEGWTVIRFWGKEIMKHIDECVKVIEETIFDTVIQENDME